MRIKKMNWFVNALTLGWASAITLAPFGIYFKKHYYERTINHEKIHWKQQIEMLIIPFYIWYFIEWFVRLFINGKKAYMSISFEREAYINDDNLSYLNTRKRFAWFNYLCIMKEDYPYMECSLCRTLDDCKHRERPDVELGLELPPDVCPKAMQVMRRTTRKRKINKNKN